MSANSQQEGAFYSVFRSYNSSNNLTSIPFPDFNETICFGRGSNTYMDIVNNSEVRNTLHLTIDELTEDSTKSRIAKKNNKPGAVKKIPRPQNAWIIYRRDKYELLQVKKSSIASKIIGKMWKNEPSEVREYYVALSMLALDNHRKKHGDEYKFRPQPKSRSNTRKLKKKISPETKIPTPATLSPAETSMELMSPEMTLHQEYPTPATTVTSEEDANIGFELECMTMRQAFPDYSKISITNQPNLSSEEISSLEDFMAKVSTLAACPSQLTARTEDITTPLTDFQLYSEDDEDFTQPPQFAPTTMDILPLPLTPESPLDVYDANLMFTTNTIPEHFTQPQFASTTMDILPLALTPEFTTNTTIPEHFTQQPQVAPTMMDILLLADCEPLTPESPLDEPATNTTILESENQHQNTSVQYDNNEGSIIFFDNSIEIIDWQINNGLPHEDQMDFYIVASRHSSL